MTRSTILHDHEPADPQKEPRSRIVAVQLAAVALLLILAGIGAATVARWLA